MTTASRRRAALLGEGLAWWVLLQVFYLGSLSTVDAPEAAVAAAVAAPSAVLAAAARRSNDASWRLPRDLPRWLLTMPVAVVADGVRLLALLARPARLRRATGHLQRRPLPQEPDAVAAGRIALGGSLLSATPGSYVVDEEPGGSLVTHVLVGGPPALADRVTGGPPEGGVW